MKLLTPSSSTRRSPLSQAAFIRWATAHRIEKATLALIERIRSSEPHRRTQGRFNVRGTYASLKMGRNIQFEAHRSELPAILEFEHDADVLEYLDQPGLIKLSYTVEAGQKRAHLHCPDFFLIASAGAGWVECKTEEKLREEAEERPYLYVRKEDGSWSCPPGEAYAGQLGLTYTVRASGPKNAPLTRNITFLDDYFRREYPAPKKSLVESVVSALHRSQGISYPKLLKEVRGLEPDDLNYLISRGQVYTDLRNVVLVDADNVPIYTDLAIAESMAAARRTQNPTTIGNGGPVELVPTAKIRLDDTDYMVSNVDDHAIELLSADGKISPWKRSELERRICAGEVSGIATADSRALAVNARLKSASPEELAIGVTRWKLIQHIINGDAPRPAKKLRRGKVRSIRRWVRDFRDAFATLGNGFIGLLPKARPGYSGSHLPDAVEQLMTEIIERDYETVTNRTVSNAHGKLRLACQEKGLDVPSLKTFSERISMRPQYQQTKNTKGPRGAYLKKKFHNFLDLHTPVHGDRPWEIGHIDHTELDIELVCSKTGKNLGRPWLSMLMDAHTRRILAISLTFFSESSEACMRVIRECVKRHHRLPQILVVDHGKAFDSIYFEALLANFNITKKSRPPAQPRSGSVCERWFGTANTQFVHNLIGNTQLTKNVRELTKSVDPKLHAIWTLPELTRLLSKYCFEVYDCASHPALGESPREAFNRTLSATGMRQHTFIPNDSVFQILTMPTTKNGYAKVHSQKGVHLNYVDYWSDAFLNPAVEGQKVPVRFDPWDASVAYAFVAGEWVSCRSAYTNVFRNWSQRAIDCATAELRKRKNKHGGTIAVTAHRLAEFMEEVAKTEEMLALRAKEHECSDATPKQPAAATAPKTEAPAAPAPTGSANEEPSTAVPVDDNSEFKATEE